MPKREITEDVNIQHVSRAVRKAVVSTLENVVDLVSLTESEKRDTIDILKKLNGADIFQSGDLKEEYKKLIYETELQNVNLSEVKTSDLVKELCQREGTNIHKVSEHKGIMFRVDGPACVIIIEGRLKI